MQASLLPVLQAEKPVERVSAHLSGDAHGATPSLHSDHQPFAPVPSWTQEAQRSRRQREKTPQTAVQPVLRPANRAERDSDEEYHDVHSTPPNAEIVHFPFHTVCVTLTCSDSVTV
jgi:hypothetical protein